MEIGDTAIYAMAGSVLLPKVIDLLKWSFGRHVNQEDQAKASMKADVEDLQDQVKDLDKQLTALAANHAAHKDAMVATQNNILGRIEGLDKRVAEQGKAYEQRIADGFKQLEIDVNRRLAQAVNALEQDRDRRPRK